MSPQKRIRSVIARRGRLEDAAARAQLQLLRQLRRDIIARLADAGGFHAFRLQQMLAVVEAEIRRYNHRGESATAQAIRDAWRNGLELISASVDVPDTLYGVSPQLLQALVSFVGKQASGVYQELGTRLETEIRRVTLGVTDPLEAMAKVARLIKTPATFGRAEARAERIIRTEVNRTFSAANHERQKQADRRVAPAGERIMRYWLTAEDDRVREAHRQAGNTYDKEHPIPVDQPFIVGGEELMFPGDPSGSTWNTINCRCIALNVVVSAQQYAAIVADLKKAA